MGLSEHIVDVDEATFEQAVLLRSHEVPVLVDFWAEWCGPCLILGPMLERMAIEFGGDFLLAKVDVDENPGLSIRFGVQGIPAVKAFRMGEVVAEFVGAQPEKMVRRFLDEVVPSVSDLALGSASSLLATRHWVEASEAYQEILDEDDENSEAALGLVKSLLMQGQGDEALRMLKNFPAGAEWTEAQKLNVLARFVSNQEDGSVAADDPLILRMDRAASLLRVGNYPAAMDGLLEVLREDKQYEKGLVKDLMLAIFLLLGEDDSLTRDYREELASILF